MDHFRLLIVGAGASGFAAAARLLEKNFKDFRILEAEDRIGGRIFSKSLEDSPIELGAEWIHGEIGNIVFELASTYDLADNSPPKIEFIKTNFFDSSGQQINGDISKSLFSAYYEIFTTAKKEFNGDQLNDSLGQYFEDEFEKYIFEIRKNVKVDDDLVKKFINSMEIWQNCIDGSHSWYETSLRGDVEYWECEGNGLTVWKNSSYSTIFNLLTKNNLDVNEKVILNKEVIKVKWNKDNLPFIPNVAVECQDGTIYHADNLLLTCSLGVLKERNSMFIPSLPRKKLNCIENLGFGTVDKIFIKFKDCWWGEDFHGCGFLWSEEEKSNESSKWLSGIFGFHPLSPTLPILRGWITGEAARQMENLFEDELLNGLNYLLKKFLGSRFEVPLIEKCIVSNWYNNPHFRGSYSCRYLQSERENVWASDLAESVCDKKGTPVLLFGGEASHDHYYSTVHGAIEAGFREADKFMQSCL